MATFNVEVRQRVSGAFGDIIYPKANWNNMDNKPSTFPPTAHTHFEEVQVTINSGDWSSNQVTKTVTGVTSTNNIWVSPTPSSYISYGTFQIRASEQGTNSITFTCSETPDVTVIVQIIMEV